MAVSATSPFEEYAVGQILTLNILANSTMRVRIRQLHTRTLSCTMMVDVLNEMHPEKESAAFLKLFDRRFSDGLREEWGIEPWTKDTEEEYVESVENGSFNKFLYDLRHVENLLEDTGERWDIAQDETFLAEKLLELYEAEVETYNALLRYQGRHIPRLLAAVELDLTPPNVDQRADGEPTDKEDAGNRITVEAANDDTTEDTTTGDKTTGDTTTDEEVVSYEPVGETATDQKPIEVFEPYKVKGVLLDHIEGYSLRDIAKHFPESTLQEIVDNAIKITHVLGDHNILNKDVRLDNFIISPVENSQPQVFMIDFALCRFRGDGESDLDWGRAKWSKDEEGYVGLFMKKYLKNNDGFELNFEHSYR